MTAQKTRSEFDTWEEYNAYLSVESAQEFIVQTDKKIVIEQKKVDEATKTIDILKTKKKEV